MFSAQVVAAGLRSSGRVYSVNLIRDDELGNGSYFGKYAFPLEYTGGTVLDLFPDGVFVVSCWLDIGPVEYVASGKYAIESGALKLNVSKLKAGHGINRFLDLRVVRGYVHEKDYLTDYQVFLISRSEWERAEKGDENVTALRRKVQYHDWQGIERELMQKSAGASSD